MASPATAIEDFIGRKTLALVGVSRSGKGFGNYARKTLESKGYTLLLVHPEAQAIEGVPCVRTLTELAGKVEGVVLVTPPAQTEQLVREAAAAGIRRIWIQQGAQSEAVLAECERAGITAIHGECILMHAAPTGIHRFHRWVNGFGKSSRKPEA